MSRRYEHQAVIEQNGLYPYLVQFLEWTEVKGYSRDTLKRRQSALRRFLLWCEERSIQRPHDVTKPILERYQKHLYHYRKDDGAPLTYGSQQAFLTPIRAFFQWLARENHILYNPASELELPRLPRRLPKVILRIAEVEAILNQPDVATAEGLRDRAILEILYSTGIRRAELAKLSIYDVDAQRATLLIREGKGKKDRMLPLGERALAWVEKYRLEARPELVAGPDDGILFLNDEGRPFGRSALAARVKRHIRAAGIERPGACHLFRHAMATHMLDNGADTRFIQAMLGHAQLSTTEIYTQVSIEKLREIHTATHPAAKLRRRGAEAKQDEENPEAEELLDALTAKEEEDEDE